MTKKVYSLQTVQILQSVTEVEDTNSWYSFDKFPSSFIQPLAGTLHQIVVHITLCSDSDSFQVGTTFLVSSLWQGISLSRLFIQY